MHMGQGNVLLGAIGSDASRRLGRQAEQRLDGGRGLRARLQLQDLPEQRQRDDYRRRFKVHRYPPHENERVGEHLGRHGGHHAIGKGRAGTQADQRPHVGAAAGHRLHAARQKRPAGPQRNRQRKHQLDPALHGHVEPVQLVPEHRQKGDHHGERQRPPETAQKVRQLGGIFRSQFGDQRLQRHAALGAAAGAVLPYLRVHGAGVDGAGCRWCLRR